MKISKFHIFESASNDYTDEIRAIVNNAKDEGFETSINYRYFDIDDKETYFRNDGPKYGYDEDSLPLKREYKKVFFININNVDSSMSFLNDISNIETISDSVRRLSQIPDVFEYKTVIGCGVYCKLTIHEPVNSKFDENYKKWDIFVKGMSSITDHGITKGYPRSILSNSMVNGRRESTMCLSRVRGKIGMVPDKFFEFMCNKAIDLGANPLSETYMFRGEYRYSSAKLYYKRDFELCGLKFYLVSDSKTSARKNFPEFVLSFDHNIYSVTKDLEELGLFK